MRAGATVLLMAADPINRDILRSMLNPALRLAAGPGWEVAPEGRGALFVSFIAERWQQGCPTGPLAYDSKAAKCAIEALVEGWSTAVVHTLAREPMTFAELSEASEGIGRRALKRRLAALRDAGLVETLPGEGDELFALNDWARAGIAPLLAAARLELRDPKPGMAPIDPLDVEACFRLAVALIRLPEALTGSCRLGLNPGGEGSALTGVTVRFEQGMILSCEAGLDSSADAWAVASSEDWLDTVIEPGANRVRTGGDSWLALAVIDAMHRRLFGVQVL